MENPKLLETIPEESVLSLKDAIIDQEDPLCIHVYHKPTGQNIVVRKSFEGALVVDENGDLIEDLEPVGS